MYNINYLLHNKLCQKAKVAEFCNAILMRTRAREFFFLDPHPYISIFPKTPAPL